MEISSLSAVLPARPVTRQGDGRSPEDATQAQRQAMMQQANAALEMQNKRDEAKQQSTAASGSRPMGASSTFSIYA
ncbi:MAG: hypothetical protein ACKOC1_01430 [Hyphomicrobiales bacterium]